MNKLFFVCALFFSIHSFGIYGELNTENTDFKRGVVALYAPNEQGELKVFCSASIINQHQILTAAHCFDVIKEGIFVQYKDYLYPATKLLINSAYSREDIYDPDWGYLSEVRLNEDFALVEFEHPFAPSDFIEIYEQQPELDLEDEIFFAGYGQEANIFGIGFGGGVLRASIFSEVDEVLETGRVRVSEGRSGLCQGDSGGPTFQTKPDGSLIQVGVNSMSDCQVDSIFEPISLNKITEAKYQEYILE